MSVVLEGGRAWTWPALAAEGEALLEGAPGPLAVACSGPLDAWAALAAARRDGADLLLVAEDRLDDALLDVLATAGLGLVRGGVREREPAVPPVPGRLTVLSSGTTGVPKLVEHTAEALVTVRPEVRRRWLCPYAPGTYAWYQLALLGHDVVPVAPADATGWLDHAAEHGVDAISATPTFWRRAFLHVDPDALRALPLAQLSLGGEPVEQGLLDRLRALWPAARLSHIYASSEAGACIAVHDGRAGFPAAWLQAPRPNGLELRLDGDRLEVRSPFAAPALRGRWIATGDRVRRTADRVEVVGRADGAVVNVGGVKVVAEDVAAVLRTHPEVVWAAVRPRRAPLVGELVAADVALTPGAEAREAALIAWCAARLPEAAVPRLVRFVAEVPVTAALKAAA